MIYNISLLINSTSHRKTNKMTGYYKITQDGVWRWNGNWADFTEEMDDVAFRDKVMSRRQWLGGSRGFYDETLMMVELGKYLHDIKLGISANGFDTATATQGFIDSMAFRNVHKGCWYLYASKEGFCYCVHCSSQEMRAIAKEYDDKQRLLELLKKEGFQKLELKESCSEDLRTFLGLSN